MTLLSQLERATEGSDELDALVCAFIEGRTVRYDVQGDREYILGRSNEAPHDECVLAARHSDGTYPFRAYRPGVKRCTTNLQDAVSLVPEGWCLSLGSWGKTGGYAGIAPKSWREYEVPEDVGGVEANGETLALALCIAIIKAIESKAEAA